MVQNGPTQSIMHGLGLGLIQIKTSPDPQKNYYERYTQNTSTKCHGLATASPRHGNITYGLEI